MSIGGVSQIFVPAGGGSPVDPCADYQYKSTGVSLPITTIGFTDLNPDVNTYTTDTYNSLTVTNASTCRDAIIHVVSNLVIRCTILETGFFSGDSYNLILTQQFSINGDPLANVVTINNDITFPEHEGQGNAANTIVVPYTTILTGIASGATTTFNIAGNVEIDCDSTWDATVYVNLNFSALLVNI